MPDRAYLTTFRVPPQNVFQAEVALRGLVHAVADEEVTQGGVEVFAVHRVPGDPGVYQIYEQYTKAAATRHGTGPLVGDAWRAVLARMVSPFERVLLDPIGAWGSPKELASDVTADACWRFTVRVAPEDAGELEEIFDEIMEAMAIDEFPHGEVKTYGAHRVAGDVGRYVMYEHFTALGSSQHARGPSLAAPGMKQMRLLITPFERAPLEPLFALGTEHAAFAGSAPKSVKRSARRV